MFKSSRKSTVLVIYIIKTTPRRGPSYTSGYVIGKLIDLVRTVEDGE